MSDTATPNVEPERRQTPDKRVSARRKTDVLPRAHAAARRTKMVQLALFALAAVITIDAFVGDKGLLQTYRAKTERVKVVNDINKLRADNRRLRERVRRLTEDPAAIEEAARRHLGLVKPGEILVIVKDAEKR